MTFRRTVWQTDSRTEIEERTKVDWSCRDWLMKPWRLYRRPIGGSPTEAPSRSAGGVGRSGLVRACWSGLVGWSGLVRASWSGRPVWSGPPDLVGRSGLGLLVWSADVPGCSPADADPLWRGRYTGPGMSTNRWVYGATYITVGVRDQLT